LLTRNTAPKHQRDDLNPELQRQPLPGSMTTTMSTATTSKRRRLLLGIPTSSEELQTVNLKTSLSSESPRHSFPNDIVSYQRRSVPKAISAKVNQFLYYIDYNSVPSSTATTIYTQVIPLPIRGITEEESGLDQSLFSSCLIFNLALLNSKDSQFGT
jgi:hypothetical protein